MTSDADTYRLFFAAHGIATVEDYDEVERGAGILSRTGHRHGTGRLAIVGISGGQTALACDVASSAGVQLARFGDALVGRLRAVSPASRRRTRLDFGSVVDESALTTSPARSRRCSPTTTPGTCRAVLQDCQADMHPAVAGIPCQADQRLLLAPPWRRQKPIVAISPTSEPIHPDIRAKVREPRHPDRQRPARRPRRDPDDPRGPACRRTPMQAEPPATPEEMARKARALSLIEDRRADARGRSQLTPAACLEILAAYGYPRRPRPWWSPTRPRRQSGPPGSAFPLAVKVASKDIAHRSDVGGVVLRGHRHGRAARSDRPDRRCQQSRRRPPRRDRRLRAAAAGPRRPRGRPPAFVASPPFGVKVMVGTGGLRWSS